MSLNFDNVESAKVEVREQLSSFKAVQPGLQTLTVESVEPVLAANGTPGVMVKFNSKEAEASFTERFWLSEKAAPRVQYLVEKFTGAKLTGGITGEGQALAEAAAASIGAKVVGTTKPVIVDGEEYLSSKLNKEGKPFVNIRPTLRFAGFVEPEGGDAEPRIKRAQAPTITEAPANPFEGGTSDEKGDDLPF